MRLFQWMHVTFAVDFPPPLHLKPSAMRVFFIYLISCVTYIMLREMNEKELELLAGVTNYLELKITDAPRPKLVFSEVAQCYVVNDIFEFETEFEGRLFAHLLMRRDKRQKELVFNFNAPWRI